jgi:hypothetical protein
MIEVNAREPSSVGLIYTRGQVTCDTSHPAVAPAIDIPLVGQDTKPRLGERAGHVAIFRAGTDGETLRPRVRPLCASSAQGCQQYLTHWSLHEVHKETRNEDVIPGCEHD